MERIGITASKIAKGNLFLYNLFVLVISILFSLLLFFIAGCSVVIMIILIAYVSNLGTVPDLHKGWIPLMIVCMKILAALVGLFVFFALAKNVKWAKH